MSDQVRAGWALRQSRPCPNRGHNTWDSDFASWWTCCPPSTTEETAGENKNSRCNLGSTKGDLTPPRCANSSWNVWVQGQDGYFCCEEGLIGFSNIESSVGCENQTNVESGYQNGTMLKMYPLGASSTASAGSGSSINRGAIAGGVVGGVCGALIIIGMIWLLIRRRRKSTSSSAMEEVEKPKDSSEPSSHSEVYGGATPVELGDRHIPTELPDDSPARKELPGDTKPRQELPGDPDAEINRQPPSELP